MPRPKIQDDDTILDALGRVLAQRGPTAFTLTDVATEAGLSAATLVQRFGSKRGMVLAFAERAVRLARQPFDRGDVSREPPLRELRRALKLMAAPVGDAQRIANSVALLAEDLKDPELRAAAAAHADSVESAIAEKLAEAHRLGQLDVDPKSHARLVYAAYNGALIQWGLRGRGSLGKWLDSILLPLLGQR